MLSVWFSGIKYVHIAVQLLPAFITLTFSSFPPDIFLKRNHVVYFISGFLRSFQWYLPWALVS